MKKLLTSTLVIAIFGSAIAQHTPPRPPRPGQLPPHPRHRTPPLPPRPKTPDEVARDVDYALRNGEPRRDARAHKYVKYNNGKHKGHYKKYNAKRHKVVRRHR